MVLGDFFFFDRVFDAILSNTDKVLSAVMLCQQFVCCYVLYGYIKVDHKSCLIFSGGTDWSGALLPYLIC